MLPIVICGKLKFLRCSSRPLYFLPRMLSSGKYAYHCFALVKFVFKPFSVGNFSIVLMSDYVSSDEGVLLAGSVAVNVAKSWTYMLLKSFCHPSH